MVINFAVPTCRPSAITPERITGKAHEVDLGKAAYAKLLQLERLTVHALNALPLNHRWVCSACDRAMDRLLQPVRGPAPPVGMRV